MSGRSNTLKLLTRELACENLLSVDFFIFSPHCRYYDFVHGEGEGEEENEGVIGGGLFLCCNFPCKYFPHTVEFQVLADPWNISRC